jgi:hypothetical protein
MKKGIEALLTQPLTGGNISYQVAFRMQALAKLLRQVDRETALRVRQRLREDLKMLEDGQSSVGGWSYGLTGGTGIGDFSNIQIVMMGIGEAIRVGLEPRRDVIEKTMMLYIEQQMADGGWNYGRQVHNNWPWTTDQANPSYGSMTAAGVASLYICRDYLFANMGCPCSGGRSTYRANKVDEAIEKALDWLGREFVPDRNPKSTHWHSYWLYSCERVGLATGIKYFGEHNWYHVGAGLILAGQRPDGSWGHRFDPPSAQYPQGSLVTAPDTVWNMLFLIKGRAPILMNKLRFEGNWNLHPTDVARLARYVGNIKEQEFIWQVIDLKAPVAEWHDAPIVYISAESIIKLTDEDKAKLREYTFSGGTILFEASCGNPIVRTWWQRTAAEIWPEFELRRVDREHALWTADAQMRKQVPGLMEMADGVRAFVFYASNDISCAWVMQQIPAREEAFQLGLNMYTYATDRARIRSRLMAASSREVREREVATLKAPAGAAPVRLVPLRHGGDWAVTRHYDLPAKLAARLKEAELAQVEVDEPRAVTDEAIPEKAVLYVTGRQGMMMSEAERAALKGLLEKGAFLVADATLGDERFVESFRQLIKEAGLQERLLPLAHPIVGGAMDGATGHDLSKNIGLTHEALRRSIANVRLELTGIYLGERLVGVFSPRDLFYSQAGMRAYQSVGFDESTAQRVVDNIMLYVQLGGK